MIPFLHPRHQGHQDGCLRNLHIRTQVPGLKGQLHPVVPFTRVPLCLSRLHVWLPYPLEVKKPCRSVYSSSVVSVQTSRLAPLSPGSQEIGDINGDYFDYESTCTLPVDSDYYSATTTNDNAHNKRKASLPDEDDPEDQGPLLSEYLCPICYSPPRSAIVTLCGHILCGSCLHGATTTRQTAARPLCPVCRTPLPNLQFAFPSIQFSLNPNIPLNVMNGDRSGGAGLDVGTVEERWDPARSGVIGLEMLTVSEM
ncbi:hypothetical protein RSAG8_04160, partial [Rhizoctonia solani AG-8 WAC10335]